MTRQEAVTVRNAVKSYEKDSPILEGLNMTICRGSIYGLLGASGCGKTTLLSCIVGVCKLNSGEIWVLGGKPGSKDSGIPGPRVGYMPQDIALVGEFTVDDSLYYFGTINGMQRHEIEKRKKFLSELLELPHDNHMVKNMSGGQQRRVSLAAALIHSPELLILDEPTVGLDPILREKQVDFGLSFKCDESRTIKRDFNVSPRSIWSHLMKITKEEGTTIIITTHYVEEAKDADKIGLMRCGKLLAESSPHQLLQRFQSTSLEEVFLELSTIQENTNNTAETSMTQIHETENTETNIVNQDYNNQIEEVTFVHKSKLKATSQSKFKALMKKNTLQFIRHYTTLSFAILFPILQVSAFFIGISHDPKSLIGIINDEAGNCNHGNDIGNVWYDEETFTCQFNNLTCRFLHELGDSLVIQKHYNSISEATAAVHNGTLAGMIYLHRNFSQALETRLINFAITEFSVKPKNSDIINSQIQISLDTSDFAVGSYIKNELLKRFTKIYENVMRNCTFLPKLLNVPIRFEHPIYGKENPKLLDFMAPVYLMAVSFVLGTIISTPIIIGDRLEGVWTRSQVQGVQTWEIFLSHVLSQTLIAIIQTTLLLCMYFPMWGLIQNGSMFLISLFTFLSLSCGMMYGFALSVNLGNYTLVNFASNGSFLPLIILCGMLWPLEGIPIQIRWFSMMLPITIPSVSLREVFIKGHSLYEPVIYNGILVIIGWIIVFYIICLIGIKRKLL